MMEGKDLAALDATGGKIEGSNGGTTLRTRSRRRWIAPLRGDPLLQG
jgi:hypothetical protein